MIDYNKLPLVTIIIPSYNHAQYISNAIESVLNQKYDNIELIIVDDGSTDNSHKVILKYKNNAKVVTILNQVNKGQSAVINQALLIAKGKYVQILPSDDWFLPEKTSLQVNLMESLNDDVGVVYAAGKRFYEDTGKINVVNLPIYTGFIASKLIEKGNFIYPITPMFRRKVFDKVRFSEKFIAEGEAIHMRIALYYKYEYLDNIVAVMRDHSYNIGKNSEKLNEEIEKHCDWYFSNPDLPISIKKLKKNYLLRNYQVKAMQLIFDDGKNKLGRENILKSYKLSIFNIFLRPKIFLVFFLSFLPFKFLVFLKKLKKNKQV